MELKVEVLEHIHQVQLSKADKMIPIFKVIVGNKNNYSFPYELSYVSESNRAIYKIPKWEYRCRIQDGFVKRKKKLLLHRKTGRDKTYLGFPN